VYLATLCLQAADVGGIRNEDPTSGDRNRSGASIRSMTQAILAALSLFGLPASQLDIKPGTLHYQDLFTNNPHKYS